MKNETAPWNIVTMLVISIIDHWQWHWSVSGGHSSYPQQSNSTQSDPPRKHIAENTSAETL